MVLTLAGCAWGGGTDSHGVLGTDARVRMDGGGGDTPRDMTGATVHLLLTEVALRDIGGEFIEIHNPTAAAVALDNYYLADIGNYWTLPAAAPNVAGSDFVVKFPAGAMIAPGAVMTIATGTAVSFMTTYGSAPTYSITDGTITAVAVGIGPTLTDGGEIVVLFTWDGVADLVKDVDIMLAGVPTMQNTLVSKSGQMQGTATYATDAETILAQAAAHGAGQSTKRIAAEGGNELHPGNGNGITGDDETSENTAMTWDTTFSAPTPGSVPTL